MSSYKMLGQNLSPYGQPAAGYQHQVAGTYLQTPGAMHPPNVVQHHSNLLPHPPSYSGPRGSGNDTDDEAAGDDDGITGPGDIPDKALDVCVYTINSWLP